MHYSPNMFVKRIKNEVNSLNYNNNNIFKMFLYSITFFSVLNLKHRETEFSVYLKAS